MRSGYRLVCSPVRAPRRAHYTRVGGWVTNKRHACTPDWADARRTTMSHQVRAERGRPRGVRLSLPRASSVHTARRRARPTPRSPARRQARTFAMNPPASRKVRHTGSLGRCFYPWRSALWRTGIVATGCDPNYPPLDTCSKFCVKCVRRPPPLMKVVAARRWASPRALLWDEVDLSADHLPPRRRGSIRGRTQLRPEVVRRNRFVPRRRLP